MKSPKNPVPPASANPKGGPIPPPPEPPLLRGDPRWFALPFFLVSLGFFVVYWRQFPIEPQLFAEYWRRDQRFLTPNGMVFVNMWLNNTRSVALLACYLALSWLAGRRALRWALGRPIAPRWSFLLSVGLGNGILGTATLGLGLVGALTGGPFWALLAVALGVGAARGRWWRAPWTRLKTATGLTGDSSLTAGEGAPLSMSGPGRLEWLPLGLCAAVSAACLAGLGLLVEAYLRRHAVSWGEAGFLLAWAAAAALIWCLLYRMFASSRIVGRSVDALLVAVIAIVIVGNFLPAFEPEWFYDSLVYHLAVPEQWIVEHKIVRLAHTFFSNFPFLQEMQYTFFLALGEDVAPKLLHWAQGGLAAWGSYALGRALLGHTGGLLAAAIFLSQPTMRFLHHITMVELGMTWCEILATLAFVRAMKWVRATANEPPPLAWLFVAGWFFGFAQGTKYIGIWASGLMLGWWVLARLRRGASPRQLVRELTVPVGWASAWTGVWLAKSWLLVGDPFFPFLYKVFPAIRWDAGLFATWMGDNVKYGTGHGSLRSWLMMPAMASIDISDFGTFTLNPFALLLLPCLFLFPGVPEVVRFLAISTGVTFVLWATSSQQTRFLFPVMAMGSVAIAFVAARLGRGSWLARGVVTLSTAWILLIGAWGEVHNRFSNNALVPYTTAHLDRLGLLRLGVQYYETVESASSALHDGDRVLFVSGDESFYLRRRRICNSIYDRSTLGELAKAASSPADLRRALKRMRVTHLISYEARGEEYSRYGIFDWGERPRNTFIDMWNTYGKPVFTSHGVFLFELLEKPLPPERRKQGMPSFFHSAEAAARGRALVGQADDLFKRARTEEALAVCEDLVRALPRASHAYAYRGYAFSLLKKPKQAMADYERAITYGYPTGVVYYNLGILLELDKQFERALGRYLDALTIGGGMEAARDRAFELALSMRRWDLALSLGEPLLAGKPGDAELKAKMARVRQMVGGRRK
ncbi:MAG: tetratricopeptide repeat protein [Candidatus Coatesbacteria bacterium]